MSSEITKLCSPVVLRTACRCVSHLGLSAAEIRASTEFLQLSLKLREDECIQVQEVFWERWCSHRMKSILLAKWLWVEWKLLLQLSQWVTAQRGYPYSFFSHVVRCGPAPLFQPALGLFLYPSLGVKYTVCVPPTPSVPSVSCWVNSLCRLPAQLNECQNGHRSAGRWVKGGSGHAEPTR